jgi:hypothetical protein
VSVLEVYKDKDDEWIPCVEQEAEEKEKEEGNKMCFKEFRHKLVFLKDLSIYLSFFSQFFLLVFTLYLHDVQNWILIEKNHVSLSIPENAVQLRNVSCIFRNIEVRGLCTIIRPAM